MSQLTDTLYLLYSYQSDDTAKLTRTITERRGAAWINEMSDLAKRHGCNQLAKTPKGSDAKELMRQSQEDAESITRTYNRELRNVIERIYKTNPRANRNAYFKELEAWAKKRDAYKTLQIGLNTDGTARYFAQQRFYQQNPPLARRFVAAGGAPTCKVCIRIFAAGVVDFEYTQKHPLPAHINCPHFFKAFSPAKVDCDTLWLGG